MIYLEPVEEDLGIPSFTMVIIDDYNPLSNSRKKRKIFMPNEPMKQIHLALINELKSKGVSYYDDSIFSGSIVLNALKHSQNTYFVLLDIHHAYPSVNKKQLKKIFQKYNLNYNIDYFFGEDGLYTGGNASALLFNLYAQEFIDQKLFDYCRKHNITYTRYLDDLVFSCPDVIGKRKRKVIMNIIRYSKLPIAYRKAQVVDLKTGAIVVNGIGINKKHKLFIPKHYTQRIIENLSGLYQIVDPFTKEHWGKFYGFLSLYTHLQRTTQYFDPKISELANKIYSKQQQIN